MLTHTLQQPRTESAKDIHGRLGEYIDDLMKDLERTKQELHDKDVANQDLTQQVTDLTLDNMQQSNEIGVLKSKLEAAESKNKKKSDAQIKLAKLRSQMASMTSLLGPEIKEESEEDV
jgi:chromosome segregation ATPase